MIPRISKRVGSDEGFGLIELAVVGLIGAMLLGALGMLVSGSLNSGSFTQGQSATLNDMRNAMQKIEKEIRGADDVEWCTPVGSCLEIGAQTPFGNFQTLRYTHVGTELLREEFDTGTATWSDPSPIVERLMNDESQDVFTCDTQTTLLRVTVDLMIEPTPQSDPVLHIQNSIRPRNFLSTAMCP